MSILIRAACLSGYADFAQARGIDVEQALRRFGLSTQAIASPESLISYAAYINLLEYSATAAADASFALHLGQRQGVEILGAIAILIRHASTLQSGLTLASRYLFFHSPGVSLAISDAPGQAQSVDIAFALNMAHLPVHAQTTEIALLRIVQALRWMRSGDFRPQLVLLPHQRLGLMGDYLAAYGCDCVFGADLAAVRIGKEDLDLPVGTRDPMLQRLAEGYFSSNFPDPRQLFSDHVRFLIRRLLGLGGVSQLDIAKALAIHPRTLQRRLKQEGFVFEDLVDAVRRERFVEHVTTWGPVRFAQVAVMLGYSDQATLTRSCRRWFGCTPAQYKKAPHAAHEGRVKTLVEITKSSLPQSD
jgi:AraC-like DNA-binding protein